MTEGLHHNNKIIDNSVADETPEFKFNFIERPWDDRSRQSKIGIIVLLVSIAVGIFAFLIANFMVHYRSMIDGPTDRTSLRIGQRWCHRVLLEEHRFVARIYTSRNEMRCVGAILSPDTVIANLDCVKDESVKLRLGGPNEIYCRKWFSVKVMEPVDQKLALITTEDEMTDCSEVISVGGTLNGSSGYVIGRPVVINTNMLSKHYVTILPQEKCAPLLESTDIKVQRIYCVQVDQRCPAISGDLLIQDGYLFGVALGNLEKQTNIALSVFADLESLYPNNPIFFRKKL